MSNLCQEHEIIDINDNPPDQEDIQDGLNLLRLDSFSDHPLRRHRHHPPCTTCGCSGSFLPLTSTAIHPPSSAKRRSPDSTSPTTDPQDPQQHHPKKPKKLFTDPTETTATASSASLRGFSKIPLPFNLSAPSNPPHVNSHPLLRRCASDPTSPPVAAPDSGTAGGVVPQSPPENAKTAGANGVPTPASKGSASLPPRPPSIRRTVSDPSPSKSFSQSASCNDDEGSNYQHWLKKLRDCTKQMNQWWDEHMPDEVLGEEEEEEENKATERGTAEDGSVTDFEEAVSVERVGECFTINFKCPCDRGYQILLSGKSCYYKLM